VSDFDTAVRIGLAFAAPPLIAALWRLAVVYRVTSTGYVYRSKGRWGETEIRPADDHARQGGSGQFFTARDETGPSRVRPP
jgi:hypothetical protein